MYQFIYSSIKSVSPVGVNAKEIHLCGEHAAIDLVRQLTISTREELEVREYDRLTPPPPPITLSNRSPSPFLYSFFSLFLLSVFPVGVNAKEIHLCGEPAAIDLVSQLTISTGEELEVREYDRLTHPPPPLLCQTVHHLHSSIHSFSVPAICLSFRSKCQGDPPMWRACSHWPGQTTNHLYWGGAGGQRVW